MLLKPPDCQFIEGLFYGAPRMTVWHKNQRVSDNNKRGHMALVYYGRVQAMDPKTKRKMSIPNKEPLVYHYLLKGMRTTKPNPVWVSLCYLHFHEKISTSLVVIMTGKVRRPSYEREGYPTRSILRIRYLALS